MVGRYAKIGQKRPFLAQFWRVFDTVSPHWRIKRLIFDCCGHVTSQTTKLEAFLGKFYPKKLKNLKSAVSSKRCVVETSMSAQNDQNRKIMANAIMNLTKVALPIQFMTILHDSNIATDCNK